MSEPLFPQIIDVLIHVGAGRSDEVKRYNGIGARKIVLAEGDPELFEDLSALCDGDPDVSLVEGIVVGNRSGSGSLIRYNFSRLNGLRRASGLAELYPGLRERDVAKARVLTVDSLLEEVCVSKDRVNCLILQAAGEEFDILEALHVSGRLNDFEYICVEAGEDALYEGAKSAAQIVEWMSARGFDDAGVMNAHDPEIPVLRFRGDLETRLSTTVWAEELKKKTEDLRLSIRMQSMLQDDLYALREQYKNLLLEKEKQDNLLEQVTLRLSAAADYLNSLGQDEMSQLNAPFGMCTTSDSDQESDD